MRVDHSKGNEGSYMQSGLREQSIHQYRNIDYD